MTAVVFALGYISGLGTVAVLGFFGVHYLKAALRGKP